MVQLQSHPGRSISVMLGLQLVMVVKVLELEEAVG
jgi:hypothetical protein